jgi:hypothetical protein
LACGDDQEKEGLALQRAMMEPGFYPHRPERVEMRQTHASWVFLVGDLAYKIKKPVRFPFLDYASLEKRKHFCEEENRINQRLAPGVYLGVVPIYQRGEGFCLGPSGKVVEYAVLMRRLKQDRMLDALVEKRAVTASMIEALAERLARFHALAECQSVPPGVGTPSQITRMVEENLAEIDSACEATIESWEKKAIEDFFRAFLSANRALFEKRVQEGRLRDGHGDLRCEHVSMNSEILIYDAIEFDPMLRSGDVALEISFLAMDLEAHGAPDLAQRLVKHYALITNDPDILGLLPFYKTYRATVRGKVETLKSQEKDVAPEEREIAMLRARAHFRLAYRYTWERLSPGMVIFCGLPGTGKTTLARRLGERSGFGVLSSDRVRKELAGIEPGERRRVGIGEDIYSEPWTETTYRKMIQSAESYLQSGQGVLLDATFLKADYRALCIELATRLRLPLLFIECRAAREAVQERLRRREEAGKDLSDATWSIYLELERAFAPLVELRPEEWVAVVTEGPVESLLMEAESLIKSRFGQSHVAEGAPKRLEEE